MIAMKADDYSIGWIAVSSDDLAVANAMLDEGHETTEAVPGDDNSYTLGRIGPHNVVIASLSLDNGGGIAVAVAATNLMRTFPGVRMLLMVGTASGVPHAHGKDIRLGDIVVGTPVSGRGAVLHMDTGIMRQEDGFTRDGVYVKQATLLLNVVRKMAASARGRGYQFHELYDIMMEGNERMHQTFAHPDVDMDMLFHSDYLHIGNEFCHIGCDTQYRVNRKPRDTLEPVVHFGTIGSAGYILRDATLRDKMFSEDGVICFDNDSAGLSYLLPSIVIRGIKDYADTHASARWQPYAAAVAAVYAKELLLATPAQQVKNVLSRASQQLINEPANTFRPRDEDNSSVWDSDTLVKRQRTSVDTFHSSLPKQPERRSDFTIGIICALPLEADMVVKTFDKEWSEESKYGKANGDINTYSTGVIAGYNVVLAHLPGMGSNSAAQAALGMKVSFTGVKIVLVVGVCGVVPAYAHQNEVKHIVLGDCIISTAVVQFDYGRRGPEGSFKRKRDLDGLGRAPAEVRGFMARLETSTNTLRFTNKLRSHLITLQQKVSNIEYPGTQEDRLFAPGYLHNNQTKTHESEEFCKHCDTDLGICGRDCLDIGCDKNQLVQREKLRTSTLVPPSVHIGIIGSSNSVLKSGKDRDELAQADKLLAFEMEGSGVWDIYPTIVIKGACDYADSHKNKDWQPYAAAVSAAGLKSLLEQLDFSDE